MKSPKDFDIYSPKKSHNKMDRTSRIRDSKPRQFHFPLSGTFRSKSKTIMSTKKIISNLAEYKNGQLTCILCKVPVKNELCWTGHVSGRVHRNNIQLLKRKAQPDNPPGASAPPETKKIKTDDHHHEFKKPAPIPADVEDRIIFKPKASSNNIQANIPVESQQQPPHPGPTTTVKFEDGGGETSEEGQQQGQAPRSGHQNDAKRADLPEGFFDDPKMDAKARGVDYVDPEEAEWQRFVKEIATEEVQSDNLQVYDEEESRKDRELDEIEDMMIHWQKVIDLEKKKDTRVKKMETKEEESGSSGDEEEFTEELNWRVKKF